MICFKSYLAGPSGRVV